LGKRQGSRMCSSHYPGEGVIKMRLRTYGLIICIYLFGSVLLWGYPWGYYKNGPQDSPDNPDQNIPCGCDSYDPKPLGDGSIIDFTNGHVTHEVSYPVFPTGGEPIAFVRRHLSYADPNKTIPTLSYNPLGGGFYSTIYQSDPFRLPNFGKGGDWNYYEYIREPQNSGGSICNTYLTLYKGNHIVLVYTQSNATTYIPPAGIYDKIYKDSSTFRRITETGELFVYYRTPSEPVKNGKLQYIQELHGHKILIDYYSLNVLNIYDASSNKFSLLFDCFTSGNISRLTLPDATYFNFSYDTINGNLLQEEDHQNSRNTYYNYDTASRVIATWTSYSPLSSSYTYDSYGKCTNHTITNQVTQETKTWTYTYNSTNYNTQVIDPAGDTTVYYYNSGTWQMTEIWKNGKRLIKRQFDNSYNKTSEIIGVTTPLTYSYQYDDHSRLTMATNPASEVTQYAWDTIYSLMTAQVNAAGQHQYFQYDTSTRDLVQLQDSMGYKTYLKYNSDGTLSQVTNAINQVINFNYDGRALLQQTITPGGNTTAYYHNDTYGWVTTLQDANGNKTQYYWHSTLGLMTAIYCPAGDYVHYSYDTNLDALQYVVDGNGHTTARYLCDAYGQLTAEYRMAGAGNQYHYDAVGRLISWQDAQGNSRCYIRNSLSQITAEQVSGRTTFRYYDEYNQETTNSILGAGVWQYRYDNLGRLFQQWTPDGATVSRGYWTGTGNRLFTTDQNGNTTYYVYDDNQRVYKSWQSAADWWTQWGYDPLGRVIQQQDHNGVFVDYLYDTDGRLTTLNYWEPTDNFNRTSIGSNWVTNGSWSIQTNQLCQTSIATVYTALGTTNYSNPTVEVSMRILPDANGSHLGGVIFSAQDSQNYFVASVIADYTVAKRQVSLYQVINGNNYIPLVTTGNGYAELNQRDRMRISVSNNTAVFEYWLSTGWATMFTFVTTCNFPSGKTGLLTGFANVQFDDYVVQNQKIPLRRYDYLYDSYGLRTTMMDQSTTRTDYFYDASHRLFGEYRTAIGDYCDNLYGYDSANNRMGWIRYTPANVYVGNYQYDNWNRLTQAVDSVYNWSQQAWTVNNIQYNYDNNGNRTTKGVWSYRYNAYNELLEANDTVNNNRDVIYSYDPEGQRYQRWDVFGNRTTYTAFDGLRDLAERDYYGNQTIQRIYCLTPESSVGQIISSRQIYGNVITDLWYHYDPTGNVLFVTDANGTIVTENIQDAYGQILTQTGDTTNSWHLTTRQLDPVTGLYMFHARVYDPDDGVWLSLDPSELDGPNWYQYGANDPVNGFDPDGAAYIVFNRNKNMLGNLDIYSKSRGDKDSKLIKSIPAGNKTCKDKNGNPTYPIPDGTYGLGVPRPTTSNPSPNGSYGPYVVDILGVPGRTVLLIHGGHGNIPKKFPVCTYGCIRVSNDDAKWLYDNFGDPDGDYVDDSLKNIYIKTVDDTSK